MVKGRDCYMRATIDREACIGCGLCPETCPEVFKMGDDNIAVVIKDPIPPAEEARAKEAVGICPTEAINIE